MRGQWRNKGGAKVETVADAEGKQGAAKWRGARETKLLRVRKTRRKSEKRHSDCTCFDTRAGKCRQRRNGEEARVIYSLAGVTETESHSFRNFSTARTRRMYYVYQESVYTVTFRRAED